MHRARDREAGVGEAVGEYAVNGPPGNSLG